jgi:pimeloyl-ACP methyl ester carboxylesterase
MFKKKVKKRMKNYLFSIITLSLILVACRNEKEKNQTSEYQKQWRNFKTTLVKKGKAPQSGEKLTEQGTIKAIDYISDGKTLQALLETKNIEEGKRKPVLVFLHGGFGLGYSDVTDCQAFTDAGFIVMSPSYRGENQNEGYYELLMGEVADAKEAIRWIAKQPYTDSTQIYTFGHSIGGAMSLNLSLHDDIPVKLGGSSAGLYPIAHDNFSPPFANNTSEADLENVLANVRTNNPEVSLRLAFYNLDQLVRKHYLYVGTDDNFDLMKEIIELKYKRKLSYLVLVEKEGTHFSSLKPAIASFLEVVQADRAIKGH